MHVWVSGLYAINLEELLLLGLQGEYQDEDGKHALIMEVVPTSDLWGPTLECAQ